MPRILLSTCHIVPTILQDLKIIQSPPRCTLEYPPLPQPFHVTRSRLERLRKLDLHAKLQAELDAGLLSSKKVFPASAERANGDLKGDEASRVLKEVEKVFPVPDAISDGMVGLAVR
jgi:hypothetical protein